MECREDESEAEKMREKGEKNCEKNCESEKMREKGEKNCESEVLSLTLPILPQSSLYEPREDFSNNFII